MRSPLRGVLFMLASGALLSPACSRPATVSSLAMPASPPVAKPMGSAVVYQEGVALDSADYVAFSPDGALFATSDRGSAALYDTLTGRRHATLHMQNSGVVFSPDGATLLVIANNHRASQLWNLRNGSLRALEQPKEGLEACYNQFCPRFVAGGTRLVAPASDRLILFNLVTGKAMATFARERQAGWAAAGNLVAFVHEEGLDLVDAESGARRHRLSLELLKDAQFLAIDAQGSRVAVAGEDHKVRFIDAGSGRVTATSPQFREEIVWLSWHPTEAKVAVGLDWGQASIWSGSDSTERVAMQFGKIDSIGWSASGDRLVVRSASKVSVLDGKGRQEIASAEANILSAASADGQYALTVAFSERPLTLVDMKTGEPRYSLFRTPWRSGSGHISGSSVWRDKHVINVATCQLSTPTAPLQSKAGQPKDAKREADIVIPDRFWQALSPPSPDRRYVVAGKFGDCMIGPIAATCTCLYDLSQKRCEKPLMPLNGGSPSDWNWSPDSKLLSHEDDRENVVEVLAVPSGAAVARLPMEQFFTHGWLGPQTLILFGDAESLKVWRLPDRALLHLHVRKRQDTPYLLAVREDGRWEGAKELLPYVVLRESADLRAPVQLLSEAPASLQRTGLCAAFLAGDR